MKLGRVWLIDPHKIRLNLRNILIKGLKTRMNFQEKTNEWHHKNYPPKTRGRSR